MNPLYNILLKCPMGYSRICQRTVSVTKEDYSFLINNCCKEYLCFVQSGRIHYKCNKFIYFIELEILLHGMTVNDEKNFGLE